MSSAAVAAAARYHHQIHSQLGHWKAKQSTQQP